MIKGVRSDSSTGWGCSSALDDAVARIGGGDLSAMGEVFDHAAPRLIGMLGRIVPDPAALDDVVRDTMVEVWREAPAVDLPHGAMPWVTAVGLRHARAAARRAVQVPHAELA